MGENTISLDNERVRIALGALLHDIGKVVQRASGNPTEKTHQEFGHDYLIGVFEKEGLKELGKELASFAKYHHFTKGGEKDALDVRNRYEKDLKLVAIADNYSAGEREFDKEKEFNFKMYTPLKSVFSTLEGSKENYFFPLKRLSEGPVFPEKVLTNSKEDYQRLLNSFTEALIKVLKMGRLKAQYLPNVVLNLMEEFFSFVPSHTIVSEEVSTDISLYDHSKTTCAVALALYNYLVETTGKSKIVDVDEAKILDSKDNRFALLIVDISGIQSFIYTVGARGSLKMLRARSFFIEMLLNFIAKKLLKELDLFDSNIIFLGGGNLTILFQNTEGAKRKVEELLKEINEKLWNEHRGRLWLNYAFEEFSGEVLLRRQKHSISELITRLHEKLNERKLQKFSTLDPKKVFNPDETSSLKKCEEDEEAGHLGSQDEEPSGLYECEVCGEEISRDEFEKTRRCKVCNSLTDLGKYVHRVKYIAYNPKTYVKPDLEFPLVCGEKLYLIDSPVESEFLWVVNPGANDLLDGTPLYCGNYPGISRIFKKEEELSENEESQNTSKEEVPEEEADLEFNYIGSELIAALKMDVDYLGYLFARGIREELVSLSRLSNLSRFLNLFFKHYINRIASGSIDVNQFSIVHPGKNYPRELVVVYAGGDDLFAIGAWHDVLEFSFDVRTIFEKFVGKEIPVTLSAGISINHVKFPVQVLAENADEEEKMSKSITNKDSLTIWGRTMKWSEWREIAENFMKKLVDDFYVVPELELKDVMIDGKTVKITFVKEGSETSLTPKKVEGKELPRRFIYKLLEISTLAEKLDKEGRFSLKPYSALAYLFGRSEKILKNKDYLLQLLNVQKRDFLVKIKPALMWLDYLIR